jgi:hypothetical protein
MNEIILQPEDVRPGNYLEYAGIQKVWLVSENGGGMVAFHNFKNCKEIHIHNVQPVTLTYDILMKFPGVGLFGKANESKNHLLTLLNGFILVYVENGIVATVMVGKREFDIKYLHQLQNLLYLLLGKEVQITI